MIVHIQFSHKPHPHHWVCPKWALLMLEKQAEFLGTRGVSAGAADETPRANPCDGCPGTQRDIVKCDTALGAPGKYHRCSSKCSSPKAPLLCLLCVTVQPPHFLRIDRTRQEEQQVNCCHPIFTLLCLRGCWLFYFPSSVQAPVIEFYVYHHSQSVG